MQHREHINLNDDGDDNVPGIPPPPPATSADTSQSPRTQAANQLGIEGQVNKSVTKRKRKSTAADEGNCLSHQGILMWNSKD